tara:strand:+ start:871 stop:1494 length:624 start_codon:yes stop_codon:yes gene_type:complete
MAEKIDGLKFLKSLSDSSKKIAEQQYAKDLTKKKREKQIALETKKFEEAQKKEAETGTEAVDRLMGEYKKARSQVVDKQGEPIVPGLEPETITIRGARKRFLGMAIPGTASDFEIPNDLYREEGTEGSPYNIGRKRTIELGKELQSAQKAKEREVSFAQQKRTEDVLRKQEEFRKIFDRPGVDPKKIEYLIREATKNYIIQKYGYGK